MTKEALKAAIKRHLHQTLARDTQSATPHDWWLASCYAINDKILEQLTANQAEQKKKDVKRVYYFSLEYLMGRLLNTNVDNLNFKELDDKWGRDQAKMKRNGILIFLFFVLHIILLAFSFYLIREI